jgi:zinc transport system substrate-binding protein
MKAIKSMNLLKKIGLFLSTFYILPFVSFANAEPKVVTSIKPLHSLVSYVMEGVGTPDIIIDGSSSPHTFQLKPSHASMLQEADIIFWIGEDLEVFLETPLDSIAKNVKRVTLMDSNEIDLLKFREKNVFDDHEGHDEHDEHGDEHGEHGDEHDEHGDEHDEHGDEHGEHGDEHDDHHDGHAHGEFDIHFWLDPEIAKTIVTIVARELSEIDVANKSTYEANAKKAINDLDTLITETRSKINSDATYIVFHDAYQYFEKRFGIEVIGALTVNPEALPGAKQLAEIREVIEHEKVNCLFSEPQFNPSIATTIAQDTGIKASVLDPLGAELDPGKDLYFDLIGDMASSLESC